MLAAVRSAPQHTSLGDDRCLDRGKNHACPDDRWPPVVRLVVFIGCSALAWGAVILLGSLLFG